MAGCWRTVHDPEQSGAYRRQMPGDRYGQVHRCTQSSAEDRLDDEQLLDVCRVPGPGATAKALGISVATRSACSTRCASKASL